jgi:hypothetical protein
MLKRSPRTEPAEHRDKRGRPPPARRRAHLPDAAEIERQAKLIRESPDSAEALDWIWHNGPFADPEE